MISAASFNFYQEVQREVLDLKLLDATGYTPDLPAETLKVFQEYLDVPRGTFVSDE